MAYEVVAQIVAANPGLESLHLVAYHEGPNWRDLRQPGQDSSVDFLLQGIQQDRGERILTKVLRDEISTDKLLGFARGLGEDQLLAVISKVSLGGGETGHIPMMDFMAPPSSKNQEVLTRLLRELHYGRGWLLESGRSYHYYGDQILTAEEWKVFLGKCLLMSGYVDDRYIGHQLVDGHCVLRLSAGKLKVSLPRVVAEF
jgi:hypothetical protein